MSGRVVEVRAEGVTVVRSGRSILEDVDLSVGSGELVALVGPNGAGKSTMLAVLAGDIAVDQGRVAVDGRVIDRIPVRELARLRAVMPQHHTLSFPFSVREVVALGRAPWPQPTEGDVVEWAMRAADVETLQDRRYPTLSGGERARVTFARVLAQQTPLMLLDEPTAALDVRHQELVMTTARERVDGGAAAVVVLHDVGLAAAYADRVVVLCGGRVAADGPSANVVVPDLLSGVYRHPLSVVHVPGRGPVVAPVGRGAARPTSARRV